MAKSKLLRSAAVGLGALVVASTVALAAGLFPGFPIVGSATYCAGISGTGSGTGSSTFPTTPGAQFGQGQAGQSGSFVSSCNVNVPAGPTIITGNELIPADTNLAGGAQPQTVLLSMASIGALPYVFSTPLSAATVTLTNLTGSLILDPAGTLTGLTVVMPTAPMDGQTLRMSSSQTVNGLVLTTTSPITISNNPTAITISTTAAYGYEFIYRAANTKWYRLQ